MWSIFEPELGPNGRQPPQEECLFRDGKQASDDKPHFTEGPFFEKSGYCISCDLESGQRNKANRATMG